MARRCGAEARVLPSPPDPAQAALNYDPFGPGVMSKEFCAVLEKSRADVLAAVEPAARQAAHEAEIPFDSAARGPCVALIKPALSTWLTLLNEAPFGDLFVIARKAALGPAVLSTVFGDALMDLRLPILIANGAQPASGGTAVLAWNGSMEAGRAMRAAMPLLLMADQVLRCVARPMALAGD